MSDYQSVVSYDGSIMVNGQKVPEFVCMNKGNSITQIDNKVFINGYEYKNGRWRRTLKALIHLIF